MMKKGVLDQIFTLKQIGEEAREKKRRRYVDFIDLEVAYDRLIRKLCGEVLRMHNVGWVNFRVKLRALCLWFSFCQSKRGESERFRIDSGVR